MSNDLQNALFYFIDKAYDYRNPINHKHLAAAYHLKEMIAVGKSSSYFERSKSNFWNCVKDCYNEIPLNLKNIIEEIV